jgi:hypothetical protein
MLAILDIVRSVLARGGPKAKVVVFSQFVQFLVKPVFLFGLLLC